MTSTSNRNANFDWLRLFLAASVAYFHAGAFSRIVNGQDVPFGIIPFPMVPTFLALSGFLMFRSFATSQSWGHFVAKRALRIVPALTVAIALSGLVWGFWRGVVGSLQTYLGGGFLFHSSGGNGSLWSLLWEEIAYLMMAILLALGAYKKPFVIWALLLIACTIAAANNQHEPTWRLTNLVPALFVGNLTYIYRDRIARIHWLIIAALVVAETVASHIGVWPPQAWFMVPVGGFLAVALCLNAPSLPRLPFDVSYGLYVFHDPIYTMASRIWPASFFAIFATGTAILLPVALLSWFLVEKPALSLKKRFTSSANKNIQGSSESLTVVNPANTDGRIIRQ